MKDKYSQRQLWFVPLTLLLAIIIDSALPAIFPTAFLANQQIVISRVTLFLIVTYALYFDLNHYFLLTFIFGLWSDAYTGTVLGLYAVLYYLVAVIVTSIKKYLSKNFIVLLMLFIILITFVDFLLFIFYREVGQQNVVLSQFITSRLIPTYIFNIVMAAVVYALFRPIFHWLGYEDYIII